MDDSLAASFPLDGERFGKGRIEAIADAGQRRRIVVVLGMHRSGTSLCAHILSALGIDMADELREASSNAKGHWERWEIVEYHDRILAHFNRSYLGPFHDFPLPAAWWADPRVHQIKGEMVAFLKQRMSESDFGFKDPRTIRLMPLWHQIFNDLKLVPKIVVCLRNPAQVARSLHSRDGIDIDIGEYRWLVHMADFFRYSGSYDVCGVEYEGWFTDPVANCEKLRTFLDLEWQQSEADLGLVLSGIIDPALRHDSPDHTAATHPLVRSLYEAARGPAGARRSGGPTDIVSQFVAFQRLQEPFQRAYELAADIAAKVPPLEQEAAALRSAVEEGDAEAERLRDRVDELARGREDDAAALAESRSRLADCEAALTQATARADEFAALLKSYELAHATSLAEFEAQKVCVTALTDERDALSATTAELQSGIEAMRAALAETNRSREEGEAVAAELRAEIVSLRRQGETTRETLRAEMASLKNELAAAREVGKAAIDALRCEAAQPAPAPSKPGWRASVLRRFGFRVTDPFPMPL